MLPVELNSFLQNVTYELLHFFWIGNVHQFRLDVDYGYRSHKKKTVCCQMTIFTCLILSYIDVQYHNLLVFDVLIQTNKINTFTEKM